MLFRQLAQARRKFFINAAEAAVGKNRDDISTAQFWGYGLNNRVCIREKTRWATVLLDFGGKRRQLEPLILRDGFRPEDTRDDHLIGLRQTARQVTLQNTAAKSV